MIVWNIKNDSNNQFLVLEHITSWTGVVVQKGAKFVGDATAEKEIHTEVQTTGGTVHVFNMDPEEFAAALTKFMESMQRRSTLNIQR